MNAVSGRRGIFVTGTDTGVGKTWVSVALLRAWQRLGVKAVGMKPVATGCHWQGGRLVNDDALLLQAHSGLQLDYALVNPYAYEPPVSPHIAARLAGRAIDLDSVAACFDRLGGMAEAVVVEGVGGWLAPLSETADLADLARRLELPVVLVVGLRLGCLNHALLTARSIAAAGLPLAGWVANLVDPGLACRAENVATLVSRLGGSCLGILPHANGPLNAWLGQAEQVLAAGLRKSGLLQRLGA